MNHLIAITGGIGSGKSAIMQCLSTLGFKVYDCDSRAKYLMDNDENIISSIEREIAPAAIRDGVIDRRILSRIVFSDNDKLLKLNAITHAAVIEDIRAWRKANAGENVLFLETAILLESNLDKVVDEVWLVDAPEQTRLERACRRDNVSAEAIRARMKAQRHVGQDDINVPLYVIDNRGDVAVLPQLFRLLRPLVGDSMPSLWIKA